MMKKKSNLEVRNTLICTRCGKTVFEGDPMGGTKIVKCPACVAADLDLTMEPTVTERVDELNGEYALNMELSVKGFPTFKISMGESRLRTFIKAIDDHRKTGEATLDEGEEGVE